MNVLINIQSVKKNKKPKNKIILIGKGEFLWLINYKSATCV